MLDKKIRKELIAEIKYCVGNELRAARVKRKKLLSDVAEDLCHRQQTIDNIESGHFHNIDLNFLIYMAAYYDKTIQIDFFDFIPD